MSTDAALKSLIAKRADLAADLEQRQAAVRLLRIDLEHIDGAIRLLDPTSSLPAKAARKASVAWSVDKGQFAAILFAKLRASQRPCGAKEVALYAMEDRGMNTADDELVKLMTVRTCSSLRYYRNRGLIRSQFKPGVGLLWEIAGKFDAPD
jgi:hypothetical protein